MNFGKFLRKTFLQSTSGSSHLNFHGQTSIDKHGQTAAETRFVLGHISFLFFILNVIDSNKALLFLNKILVFIYLYISPTMKIVKIEIIIIGSGVKLNSLFFSPINSGIVAFAIVTL